MDVPSKKLNNGFEMPVLGFGTWTIGGKNDPDPDNDDQKDIELIKAAIGLGITHIDTAEVYAAGKAEALVGAAIGDCDRSKLFLASKVQQTHLNYPDVKTALQNSLKRMGINYLDLYFLHRYPGNDQKLKECLRALDELAEEGLIKNIGISNFNPEHTRQACEWAKHQIAATQVHYSLRFREPEGSGLLRFCQQNNIMLIAWRPLGMGALTRGKTEPENIRLMDTLGEKYRKTPTQIAINWLISQPNVVTLTKTSNIGHLKENLEAADWQMEPGDIEILREKFPGQQQVSDTIPLA